MELWAHTVAIQTNRLRPQARLDGPRKKSLKIQHSLPRSWLGIQQWT